MSIHYFTTPGGEEMVVLARAELEAMLEAAAHERELAEYRAGRAPGLTGDEALEYAIAASPLASSASAPAASPSRT